MRKVWGRSNSSNVQKVMWAIGELKLACDRIDIGGSFGGNDQPPYLAINPNGVVPTLEDDDGFILWESNSIVRYLAARHGTGVLEPVDPQTRFSAQRWMDWQLSVTIPAITPIFWGLVRTAPEKRDHAAIEAGKVRCLAALGIMEAQLATTRFLAGEAFSYGDIPLGPFVYRCFRLIPDHPPLPNVERWYSEISARPPFKQHVLDIAFT